MNSLKGHELVEDNSYFLSESKTNFERQPFFLLMLIIVLTLLF